MHSVAWLSLASAAFAQAYPNRPVKVVVPWPPGQATDIAARVVAEKLQAALGQPFVVENRPGAGGSIGSDVVAKAAPDGYTLLAASSGPISIMPHLQKTPYDPLKDFAAGEPDPLVPFVLVAQPSFPAKDVKGFIANVRANPGKYSFSSSGTGATAHMIADAVQLDGAAPGAARALQGQRAGAHRRDRRPESPTTVETVAATQTARARSGRLKAFGVTARRTSAMPEVPTIAEAGGLPGYDIGAWVGYAAPAGTPREALNRLSAEMQKSAGAASSRSAISASAWTPSRARPTRWPRSSQRAGALRLDHQGAGHQGRNRWRSTDRRRARRRDPRRRPVARTSRRRSIRKAFLEHQVIFFRDQKLDPAQFMAFAAAMGEPVEYPFVKGIAGFPEVIEVKKLEHERHNFGGIWHSDTAYLDEPPMGSMLLAREVPPFGGDTLFASQYLAYDALSAA